MSFKGQTQSPADRVKNGGKIVHAGIALFGQHPVQALARALGLGGEVFEADRGVDQIAQDQARNMGLAVEKGGCRFVEHGLGERRVARRAVLHRFLEIAGQRHFA